MFYLPPYIASIALLVPTAASGVDELSWRTIVDTLAVATFAAGVFVVARYKGALEAAQASTSAWRDERDAEQAKSSRLEAQLVTEKAKIAALESRPDLSQMEALIAKLGDIAELHELNAQGRSEKIIEAINKVNP